MNTVQVQGRECAFGIDVSNNNGRRVIDAQAVAGAGFVFVVAKATEGASFRDAYYAGNRDATKAAGMLAGAYHWLTPNHSLAAQVANFLAHTSNGAALDFVACDAEQAGITDELVVGWCEQVHDATGLPVWLYCGAYTDPHDRSDRWLKFTPWLAAYGPNRPGQNPAGMAAPVAPAPWGRWDVWQFCSVGSVPGVAGNCDLNVIDLNVLAALGKPSIPEDDMTPEQAAQLANIAAAVADTQAKVTDVQGWVKGALAEGIAQLVASTNGDAGQLEAALRQVLSEHYDVALTLTPKS